MRSDARATPTRCNVRIVSQRKVSRKVHLLSPEPESGSAVREAKQAFKARLQLEFECLPAAGGVESLCYNSGPCFP